MGRRPTPEKFKVLTGNPGKRPIKKEPEPPPGIPEIPAWIKLFPVAVAEWERESEILNTMGVITMAEEAILANRSYLYSQIQEMAAAIKNEGRTFSVIKMDSLGNEIFEKKSNPLCVQIKAALTEHAKLGSLLGLDLVSRARLAIDPGKKKKSKFDGLVGVAGGKK